MLSNLRIRCFFTSLLLFSTTVIWAQALPSLNKVFTPNEIGPGSHATATFTIDNPNGAPITAVGFTDNLPAGLTLGNPANLISNCDLGLSGTLTAANGGSVIELIDAEVPGFSSCEISVSVTALTPATYTNPAITLNYSGGSDISPSADLTVNGGRPGFSKSFSPAAITTGHRSTLTFLIDNSLNPDFFVSMNFSDTLPAGMVVADPPNTSTDCAAGAITAMAGTTNVSFTATGPLNAGASCTVSLDVVATGGVSLTNVSSELTGQSGFNFGSAGFATAVLTVNGNALVLSKSFVDDPVIPGANVELLFTIDNLNRNFPATSLAFTDDLNATLPGLVYDSLLSNDCNGSVAGVGTNLINFTGGSVATEGSCSIRVSLSVPPGATQGAYPNITSLISADIDGSPVTGTAGSDVLFIDYAPVFTKEFIDDPAVPGGTVTMRYTISNTDPSSGLTSLSFTDDLELAIPGVTPTGLPLANPCGAGSQLNGTPNNLTFGNGSLAAAGSAGDSCTFDVVLNVGGAVPNGVYTSTTSNLNSSAGSSLPASDDLVIVAAPQLVKSFIDDPVAPGGTVTLEFTLSHSENAPTAATNIAFTDDLNATLAGLTAVLPVTPDPPCGPGSALTGSAGDTFLTLTGGSLQPAESCTFSVSLNVPVAAVPGNYPNTTSDVTANVGGLATSSQPAADDLRVAGLMFSKEFLTDPVIAGEITTLRFTIDNIHPTQDATITFFTDDLAAVLPGAPDLSALLPPSTDTCGGTMSGTTFLIYTGGAVTSGNSCVIEVDVQVPLGASDGLYNNITSSLAADQGGAVVVDPATDDLTVNSSLLQLSKSFTDDPVAPGSPVSLEFTLTNLDASRAISGIAFNDNLDATLSGLVATGLPAAACGGTVDAIPGPGTIDFSGGSLAAGASCSFTVTLTVPPAAAPGIYPNTTSSLTGTVGGLPVTGFPATDDLEIINLVQFSKAFDGPSTATRTAVLSFTLDNSAAGAVATSDLSFTDDLNAVIPGLVAVGLPQNDVCGVGSQISGTSLLLFTGGNLAPGASCVINVTVQLPATATAGSFLNTTSELLESGLTVAVPATASLQVEPPPAFAKAFAPDQIGVGQTSTLTFTVDNSASALSADNLDFTDNLPAGVVIANPANASTTCTGGTITAVAGSGVISYTGGSVAAGATCLVQADTTATGSGALVNVTGDLTSNSGNSGTATDTLTANPQPGFSKVFAPNPASIGLAVTLTFTIDNSGSTAAAAGLDFTDNLPAGLLVANPANASTTCTGGTLTAVPGSAVVSYSAGTLAAGASCTVQADVVASVAGDLVNLSGDLTSSLGNSGSATDTLTVNDAPMFGKVFSPDLILAGQVSVLTFTIDNSANPSDATGLDFTDNMPAAITVANPANVINSCTGGTVTATSGSSVISYTGGTVTGGSSCTLSVDVTSAINGVHVNTTGDLTSSLGNSGTATDTLTVEQGLTMVKDFVDNVNIFAGGDVEMILTVNNNASLDATNITFTDDLDAFVPGAVAVNLPQNDVCGSGSTLSGTNLVTLSNGTILAGGSCQFSVLVNIPATTLPGTYVNVTSNITADVGGNTVDGGAASAGSDSLVILGQLINVPTLSQWALMLMAMLMLIMVARRHRQHR